MAFVSGDAQSVYDHGFDFGSICRQLATCDKEYFLAVRDSRSNSWQITGSTPDIIQHLGSHLPNEPNHMKHEKNKLFTNRSDESLPFQERPSGETVSQTFRCESMANRDNESRCHEKEKSRRSVQVEDGENIDGSSNLTAEKIVDAPFENPTRRSLDSRLRPEDASDKRSIYHPQISSYDAASSDEINPKRKRMDDNRNILFNYKNSPISTQPVQSHQNKSCAETPAGPSHPVLSEVRGTPVITDIQSIKQTTQYSSLDQHFPTKSHSDKTPSEIAVLSQTAIPSLVEAIQHLRKDLTKLSRVVERNSQVTSSMSEQFVQTGWGTQMTSQIYEASPPGDDMKFNVTGEEPPELIDLESESENILNFGEDELFLHSHARFIIRLLSQEETDTIELIQRKMFPGILATGKKMYPGLRGKHFMTRVAEFGFGDVFHGKTTKSLIFKRRPFALMNEVCQNFCKQNELFRGAL